MLPSSSLRLTLVIHALHGGGAERQLCSLNNYLLQAGHVCTLITLDRVSTDRFEVAPGTHRVGLDQMQSSRNGFDAILQNRRRILSLRQAISQSRPDVVISFCDRMNITTLAACRRLAAPVLISERSDPRLQKLGWRWELARRWFYPRCATCVVQTQPIADYLRPRLGNAPAIHIIPPAIELPSEPAVRSDPMESNAASERWRLVSIGRLSEEKGTRRLIEAWRTLAPRHPQWTLSLVGEGPLEADVREQCKTLSIQERVEFLGWQDDVWKVLRESHAFVLPSRYEGFPNALIEAMHAGLPVVATDCSASIRELIDHRQNGLVAENDDTSLRETLDHLLSEAAMRSRLGDAAKKRAENYLWPHIGPRWLQVIEATYRRNLRRSSGSVVKENQPDAHAPG